MVKTYFDAIATKPTRISGVILVIPLVGGDITKNRINAVIKYDSVFVGALYIFEKKRLDK